MDVTVESYQGTAGSDACDCHWWCAPNLETAACLNGYAWLCNAFVERQCICCYTCIYTIQKEFPTYCSPEASCCYPTKENVCKARTLTTTQNAVAKNLTITPSTFGP